ncbi:MAG: hypothetical protein AAFX52_13010 [Pseudomonadota bacterium]
MLPDSPRFSKELHGRDEGLIEGFERFEGGLALLGQDRLAKLKLFDFGLVGGDQGLALRADDALHKVADLPLDARQLLPEFLAPDGLIAGAGVPDIGEHGLGCTEERRRGLHPPDERGEVTLNALLTDGFVFEGAAVGLAGVIAVVAAPPL